MAGEEGAATTAGEGNEGTPSYTSPTEQLMENLAKAGIPWVGFNGFFEKLTGVTGGTSGGKFSFSLDEMRELHRQFRAEADAFEEMYEKAQDAADKVRPLAEDPASREHHTSAKRHFGATFLPAIRQQYKFARGFEMAVGTALGIREKSEQAGADSMNSAGSGL